MTSHLKRPLDGNSRPISPPRSRRKTAKSDTTEQVERSLQASLHPITIFSWNVNGCGPLTQKKLFFEQDQTYPLRTFLRRHAWPHFLCLQEVKISATDNAFQRQLNRSANHGNLPGEPTYSIQFSLPRDKHNATAFGGKIHGVATLIRDDFSSYVRCTRKPDWDLEGRVLIHETTRDIAVINGYWVNGTEKPYRDPVTGAATGTRHDHKLRFHQNMLEETLRLENLGFYVLLIGDMNVARATIDGYPNLRTSPAQHVKNRADFNGRFFTNENGMKGIDVFRHLHGSQRRYTYYPRGKRWGESCDRVDLIIASRDLMRRQNAIVAADICDNPVDRGHSDHVPLWITVDFAANRLEEK